MKARRRDRRAGRRRTARRRHLHLCSRPQPPRAGPQGGAAGPGRAQEVARAAAGAAPRGVGTPGAVSALLSRARGAELAGGEPALRGAEAVPLQTPHAHEKASGDSKDLVYLGGFPP